MKDKLHLVGIGLFINAFGFGKLPKRGLSYHWRVHEEGLACRVHGLSSRGRHLDWCESCVLKELVGSVLRAIGLVLGSAESARVVVVLE